MNNKVIIYPIERLAIHHTVVVGLCFMGWACYILSLVFGLNHVYSD